MVRRTKILFIDDEPEWIKPQAEALEDEGYEVIREKDVDKAVKLLQDGDFDLIILDLLMPPSIQDSNSDEQSIDLRETGVKLHHAIRTSLGYTDIPIIFLSVVRDPEIRERVRALEHRYNHQMNFLTKPVLPSEVVSSVQDALYEKT